MADSVVDRQIRVFISSTFTDMKADRDYLVRFIFPQLRKLCESRGVTWGEVDLRWGVTDEQKAEGKVLPIVLAEIENCRPYFIGLLGERYGQVYRDEIPAELRERLPWLSGGHQGKSLTELEILHGVLNQESIADRALFYFRDAAYARRASEADRAHFTSEGVVDREKLEALKERIRRRYRYKRLKFPPRENYANPEELGKLVLADLTEIINDLFPQGSEPDPLDREAMDHDAYAGSRERVYIGRPEYFERLNNHAAANDTQPLAILGESGSGKSALLANWVASYRKTHPDAIVLQHYIGATPYSADWVAMLGRLMAEFKRKLKIDQDIPDHPDAVLSAFPNWLYMAAVKGRLVLVLDALNQLEGRNGAPDLVWLPPVLPENVRLVVSTLPGRSLDEIRKRNWASLTVEPLSIGERRQLIAEYLGQHAKGLSSLRVDRIAAAAQSANPLYLRVLLDELRLVRTHEELEERISDYLKTESTYELFGRVIARWEEDYDAGSHLVGDTLSLLWAARQGLSEAELMEALGKDGKPLPGAKWSPLFLAMSGALINRGGLLSFAHDYLRMAASDAYIPAEEQQRQAHLRLADYFERQPAGSRRTDELPWQLAEASAWNRISALLEGSSFLVDAWEQNRVDVENYWVRIEQASPFRMIDVYRDSIQGPAVVDDGPFLTRLDRLLSQFGHVKEAIQIRSTMAAIYRADGDERNLALCLSGQGLMLNNIGRTEEAERLLREAEAICRRLNDKVLLEGCLNNLAVLLQALGKLSEALLLLKEEEQLARELGDMAGTAASLNEQALIFWRWGDTTEALSLLSDVEYLGRRIGDPLWLSVYVGHQALILADLGRFEEAMRLMRQQEQFCCETGDQRQLGHCLGNQAQLLFRQGQLDESMALHKQEERLCRNLNDLSGLEASLNNQGLVLSERGQLEDAMGLYKDSEQICRDIGKLQGLAISIGNQASILFRQKDVTGALRLIEESERICIQLNDFEGRQRAMGNRAEILKAQGDPHGAVRLFEEKEAFGREVGRFGEVALALFCKGLLVLEMGRAVEGLKLVEQAYYVASSNGCLLETQRIEQVLTSLRESAGIDMDDPAIQTAFGDVCRLGNGVEQDQVEATRWYRKAAEQGFGRAEANLAYMYIEGRGVERDSTEAAYWARRSAMQGDAAGQQILGFLYLGGRGMPRDDAEAWKWLRKAAEQGNATAQTNLGTLYAEGRGVAQDDVEAIKWYLKAAHQGEAGGQNGVGWMCTNGRGMARDDTEALCWFRKAAEQGDATAQTNLGWMHDEGRGVPQSYVEAEQWYRRAAEQGNAGGQNSLGWMYLHSQGMPCDDIEAVRWFQRAAEAGNAKAQANLGWMYAEGRAVVQDDVEAVYWYRKCAEQGNASGQHSLGWMYATGRGVAQDDVEAVQWYRESAEQGNADGQNALGLRYLHGLGVARDDIEAVRWFRRAAEPGNAEAQANLGWMYAEGRAVAQDDVEAVNWYRKSAEQGNADGQRALGWMFSMGRGVVQNDAEAVAWYRNASEQGNANAQRNLGLMYEQGTGVAQSLVDAICWYRRAAEQGQAEAKADLLRLSDDAPATRNSRYLTKAKLIFEAFWARVNRS